MSMVSRYVRYVFVKRLCNNLPLYTTSPGLLYVRNMHTFRSGSSNYLLACFQVNAETIVLICKTFEISIYSFPWCKHDRLRTNWKKKDF